MTQVVLDVNYFPSYKELRAELPSLLEGHFTRLVNDVATKPKQVTPP